MNIGKELVRVKSYGLISFDIFDTLIERDVSKPSDIFLKVGYEVLKDNSAAKLFQRKRIKAEADARLESKTGEVNLKDIYRKVFVCYGIKAGILKEAEERIELQSCRPREQWKALMEACIKSGKKVILISDMYLSSLFIRKILDNCGIIGYAAIYVSNEYDCNKISGELFKIARTREGFDKGLHLHYGDSFKADYRGAQKAGITPRLVLKRNWFYKLIRKLL